MRRLVFALCLSLCCLLLSCPRAEAQGSDKPITEHGLTEALRLHGLKNSELVSILEKRGVDFVVTDEIQRQLVSAGATPEVIDAARNNFRGVVAPSTESVAPVRTTPPPAPKPTPSNPGGTQSTQANGVYVKKGGSWVALHQESTEYQSAAFGKALSKAGGLLKLHGEVTAEIPGAHSSTEIQSPASFLIRMPSGLTANDYMLVHLHPKHDNREFKIAAENLKSKDDVGFRTVQLSGNELQIEVSQGAGDYAFVSRRNQPSMVDESQRTFLYTFQVAP